MPKSIFIVVDGLDGCGKGEMVRLLQQYFSELRYNVLVTKEPTNGKYGRQIKEILLNEKDPMQSAKECAELFVKDRGEHVENLIKPFLEKDKAVVICDRYYYSTIAFQRTQGVELDKLVEANKEFIKPTIAFILDLPVDVALERVGKRGLETEKFEKKEFMDKLHENYLKLKDVLDDNIVYIDATPPIKEVFEKIKEHIKSLLD